MRLSLKRKSLTLAKDQFAPKPTECECFNVVKEYGNMILYRHLVQHKKVVIISDSLSRKCQCSFSVANVIFIECRVCVFAHMRQRNSVQRSINIALFTQVEKKLSQCYSPLEFHHQRIWHIIMILYASFLFPISMPCRAVPPSSLLQKHLYSLDLPFIILASWQYITAVQTNFALLIVWSLLLVYVG